MTEPTEEAQHLDPDGPLKGWSASDLSDDELVDDDWIKENTKEAE